MDLIDFNDIDYEIPNFLTPSPFLLDLIDQSSSSESHNTPTIPYGDLPGSNSAINPLVSSPDDLGHQLLLNQDNNSTGPVCGSSIPFPNPVPHPTCEPLEIIAQPSPTYRPRYASEIEDGTRSIQTSNGKRSSGKRQYMHPTVKIPSWCQGDHQWFVQVALVTIRRNHSSDHYIHPYDLIPADRNSFQDTTNNSLYFRVSDYEYQTREKSFRMMILKKREEDLQSTKMRLFSFDEGGMIENETPSDLKQRKRLYQLSKSQFVFTIVQRQNNTNYFLPIPSTSVVSDVMSERISGGSPDPPRNGPIRPTTDQVQCVPQSGNWNGGESLVLFLPHPVKKHKYTVAFDFGENNCQTIDITQMDTRTVLIQTPKCPLPIRDRHVTVSIIIKRNRSQISTVDFIYLAPIVTTTTRRKRSCDPDEDIRSKKPLMAYGTDEVVDSAKGLADQMNELSLEKTDTKRRYNSSSSTNSAIQEKLINIDKRLGKLRSGLDTFVRTNNPSELFRAAGTLLLNSTEACSALHDALENGHISIASSVIEQTLHLSSEKNLLEKVNTHGQTPLLIAAKKNQWEILKLILEHRLDLIKQKDHHGNNLFHLLIHINGDQAGETLEKILRILPDCLKEDLVNEMNADQQTPIDIAQCQTNIVLLKILHMKENNLK